MTYRPDWVLKQAPNLVNKLETTKPTTTTTIQTAATSTAKATTTLA